MSASKSDNIQLDQLLTGNPEQLTKLLMVCFKPDEDTKHPAISTAELIALLNEATRDPGEHLISQAKSVITPEQSLSKKDFAILSFAELLTTTLANSNNLDAQFAEKIKLLKINISTKMLHNISWILDSAHPLQQSITAIYKQAVGWQPSKSKAADKFFPVISDFIEELARATDDITFSQINNNMISHFNQEQTRLDKLEHRLKDAETGALRARYAQQQSARLINQQIAGKKLPKSISDFIKTHWRDSLILLLIQNGEDSKLWKKAQQVTTNLVNSLQATGGDEDKQQAAYGHIAGLTDDIRELLVSLSHNQALLEENIALIEEQHLNILKGGEPEYHPFDLVDNTNPLNTTNTKVSKTLIDKVTQFGEGQWFIHKGDNEITRIKLIVKMDDVQQLLFGNRFGIKAAQFGFEEFALKLSTKNILPIRLSAEPQATSMKLIGKLFEKYDAKRKKVSELKAELARKEAAKEKALSEAKSLEETQQNPVVVIPEKEEIVSGENMSYEDASAALDAMDIGSRIKFAADTSNPDLCKLAVKLQSTGKYIFVDKSGIKKHELSYTNLLNQLITGSAEIIGSTQTRDDTLELVVKSLRNDNA